MADLQEMLGTTIRRERRARRLTLRELADRAALSEVYLGEIERGQKYPSARVLEELARALDLDIAELLDLVAQELRAAQPVLLPQQPAALTPPPTRAASRAGEPRMAVASPVATPGEVAALAVMGIAFGAGMLTLGGAAMPHGSARTGTLVL
jgi:transcriptional regulator with XRE-family HTH domain